MSTRPPNKALQQTGLSVAQRAMLARSLWRPQLNAGTLGGRSPMFSQRALTYLRTLERRDYVQDISIVRDALLRSGIPAKDVFLELHAALAGYVEPAGHDEFVYGIVHPDSYWYGALSPDAHQSKGLWYVTYVDGHPSYTRQVDEKGVIYTDGGAKEAASFLSLIEHRAYIAEFWKSGKLARKYVTVPKSSVDALKSRLEPFRVRDLSDGVATIWSTPTFLLFAAESPQWLLWMRPESPLGELAQFVRF